MTKFHPLIVHFPIAFLYAAALFAFLSFFIKKEVFKEIVFWNLLLGVLGATIAALTGLIDEQGISHNEEITEVMEIHKYNGMSIIFVFQVLLIWFGLRRNIFKNKEYMVWFIFLLFGVSMIFYQGFLGGKMVYELGAGVEPMEKQRKEQEEGIGAGSHDENKNNSSDDMKGMDMNSDNKKSSDKNSKDDMKDMDMNSDNKKSSDKNSKKDMKGMDMNSDNKNNSKQNSKDDMKGMDMNNNNKNNSDKNSKDDMKGMDMNNIDKKPDTQNKKNYMNGMKMPGMDMAKKNAMDTITLEDNNPGRKKVKTKKYH